MSDPATPLTRESVEAIYVSNIPMLWPLFRKLFKAGSFANSTGFQSASKGSGTHELSRVREVGRSKAIDDDDDLTTRTAASPNGSQEQINKVDMRMEIETRVSFTIEDARHSPQQALGSYDVERYGNSQYKASISGGGAPHNV